MNSLMKKATIAFLAFVMFTGVVYTSYVVYSKVVGPITVTDYSLTLSVEPNGREVTFSGRLIDPMGLGVGGKTITIYETDATGTTEIMITTAITNANGDFVATETMNVGEYYFKAAAEVP